MKPDTGGNLLERGLETLVHPIMEDDIFREINEADLAACAAEIERLKKKRRGFKAAFTQILNVIDKLIQASKGPDNKINKSESNRLALERAFEKLEQRFEKLERINYRILSINQVPDDQAGYQEAIDANTAAYTERIEALGQLRIAMIPNANQQAAGNEGQHNNIKTVTDLKPSYSLSFDNTPMELSTWITCFKAYFEASRLHTLPLDQQQAFLRQYLNPNVWTAIKQNINIETRIFNNPLDPDEESCESIIEEAFQVHYPLIMRRHKFFTYERKGNQNFTDFVSKLEELATAANLEAMEINDYKMFRIIAGLNDPKCVDKLLSIPIQDFTFEEVKRVGVQYQTAKNYSGLHPSHHVNQVVGKRNPNQNRNSYNNSKSSYTNSNSSSSSSVQSKLNSLRQKGKCVGCGKKAHSKGQTCPHKSATCHKCGLKGHIAPVCCQTGPKSVTRKVVSQQSKV